MQNTKLFIFCMVTYLLIYQLIKIFSTPKHIIENNFQYI